MERSSCRLTGTTDTSVRLERPGLSAPDKRQEAVHGEPRHRISNIRHVVDVLRPTFGHLRAVLEDLPNCEETDKETPRAEKPVPRKEHQN